ncbi:MAG: TonB-dependent receptor plug domain-containing protein [Chitinophagaceae bacterium]|nr:TonB-dependent receptor plug domain-containing protein [Chitinophagaceae bacterium]
MKNSNERISANQFENNDQRNPTSSSIQIKNVNGKTPLIVIDGEIVSEEVMAKLDQETIESIDVLKDKSATALYGDKGKDGVLIIKTKAKGLKESNPLVVLDGKIVTKTEMDNLSPHSIESINVLKGKNATDLYAEKGKDGVIIITSKKN